MLSRRTLLAGSSCAVALLLPAIKLHAQGGGAYRTAEELVEIYGPIYQPPQDLADWFETLKRPDVAGGQPHNGDMATVESCCSAGDAYPIEIIEEATPPHGGTIENGVARIIDPSKRQIIVPTRNPDGSVFPYTKYREEITGPLTFHFSSDRVTREKDGNPTKTAWVFVRVLGGRIDYVYCVVPLPPSS